MSGDCWRSLLGDGIEILDCNRFAEINSVRNEAVRKQKTYVQMQEHFADLDFRVCYGVRSPIISIEGRKYSLDLSVDLHGFSLESAHKFLCKFVTDSYSQGFRCLLVVTGYGRKGSGLLREHLVRWVQSEPFSSLVLFCVQASKSHGGKGAFYLVIRRNRSSSL